MQRPVPIARLHDVLNTDRGLTSSEVSARRQQYGTNDIVQTPPDGWRILLQDTAKDPMLWFLLGTSMLFAFLGDYVEALTLLAAIIPLVGMDAVLHRRTQASTEGLAGRLATHATTLRDGKTLEIPAVDLVPGDVVTVSAGQAFPADGIIIRGEMMQADESILTGEAYPVRKQPVLQLSPLLAEVSIDAVHWGYAGTRLLTGTATVRLIYTGAETLYGEIVRSAQGSVHGRTPLQSAITQLVTVLIIAAIVICLILAWIRLHQGFGIVDAVLSAVTLAVAALPEEFPVVFTFFLGLGVYRLARRQALVRRAVVVENIGRVSCICSDKTGTITLGQLHLTHRYPAAAISEARLLSLAALACRTETADPMDVAILSVAPPVETSLKRLHTFPFTEDRKRETGIWCQANGSLLAAMKGAPEVLLPMTDLCPASLQWWQAQVTALAESGHKVIACACRDIESQAWVGAEPDRDLVFAGLLAFEDPVRDGVAEAMQSCRDGGIHVLMVTGDHPATATAVARDIGLGGGNPRVVEAQHLETTLRQTDGTWLATIDVVARAVPSQKLSLVRSLQAAGNIVAVTGDGVNDVPALQAADVGLAMGERGTRSAREVAAIVLLDDNFRTIIRAIAEGRQLFRNLQLSFAYLLMIHIPLVITAALIPLAGFPLLYLPVHIVWLELIIHPSAILVFQELPGSDRLQRLPQRPRWRFFTVRQWLVIAAVGILITAVTIGGYYRGLESGPEVGRARATALATLTGASAMLTAMLSGLRTTTARLMVCLTLGLSTLLIQTPGLAALLHLQPLQGAEWLGALGGALLASVWALLVRCRATTV
jgi:Ca2+-transporting ATPase